MKLFFWFGVMADRLRDGQLLINSSSLVCAMGKENDVLIGRSGFDVFPEESEASGLQSLSLVAEFEVSRFMECF